MKKLLHLFIFCFTLFNLQAQNDELWTKRANLKNASLNTLNNIPKPVRFDQYRLNLPLLKEKLKNAPQRGDSFSGSEVVISFPNDLGIFEDFQIMEASVMEPELQKKYPDIKSYIGQGIDHPGSIVRFSVTPWGINCLLLSNPESPVLIDPYTKDGLDYMVYSKRDLPGPEISLENDMVGSVSDKNINILKSAGINVVNDGKLRTFRLALATTGEYSQSILNNYGISDSDTEVKKKNAVLSSLNIILTKVNAVFERDVCLTMKLVANNTAVIFLDEETDGYTSRDKYKMLEENQLNCDRLIGSANYDIGHVIGIELFGGVASVSSVCTSLKAWGVSEGTWGTTILHEMGHQYGAHHTFNSCASGSNTPETSVEPECGQTIMSYGSPVAEFFHSVSIREMRENIMAGQSVCATLSITGNTAPTANAGADLTIPKSTPFVLEGQGTDLDGNAGLTYSWEQTDAKKTFFPNNSGAGKGPVFKWITPSSTPNRYMPDLNTIISGSIASYDEVVPSVSRKLNFNFIVRDNDRRGGQTATDAKVITVDGNSGPFVVTSHKLPETWEVGSIQTITWDVAGTDRGAVNTPTVDILFSSDGGHTYPTKLATKVPNDGSQDIIVPSGLSTRSGRYMVRAVGNVFFALNNANLTVEQSPFLMAFDNQRIEVCTPETSASIDFTFNTYLGYTDTTTFSAETPSGTLITFSPARTSINGTKISATIGGIPSLPGKDTITIIGKSSGTPAIIKKAKVILQVFDSAISPLTLISPGNGAQNVSLYPTMTWTDDGNAETYSIEIATDQAFKTIVETAQLTTNVYCPTLLKTNKTYYWRVKPGNPCGNGTFSTVYSFKTLDTSLYTYIPDDNFQQALRKQGIDDGDIENYVLTSRIQNIGSLNVSGLNIHDLTGIQGFSELTDLRCYDNQLTSLDLSKNKKLETLDCNLNNIESLDLTQNTLLRFISCDHNYIEHLDLSKNKMLENLRCNKNNLTSLDLTQNIELVKLDCSDNQLMSLDLSKNKKLVILDCSFNSISYIDVTQCSNLSVLSCVNNQLANLDVTKNTNLSLLNCSWNYLTSIDVSQNIALYSLVCNDNRIVNLDVTKNIALNFLVCNNNQLPHLDVTRNTTLKFLYCRQNKLPDLDITKNIALEQLDCGSNLLPRLDLTQNTVLRSLYCWNNKLPNLDLTKNVVLEQIDCSNNQLPRLDLTQNTALRSLRCSNNQLPDLDITKNVVLEEIDCSYNQLPRLDLTQNTVLKNLFCRGNQLRDLDLTKNVALEMLFCENNQLVSLDLTRNSVLNYLYCYSNQLTSLDLINNSALSYLFCNNNQLTSLDLSKNTDLNSLYCGGNKLINLDIKNGKNSILSNLDVMENPDLACIQVDNSSLANNNPGWSKDAMAVYSEFCCSPAQASTIIGLTSFCAGQNSATYTIPAIENATSYIWTLPQGAKGTSTTNSITVEYGALAVSGEITVKGNNPYLDGPASTLAIVINPLPVAAGSISGPGIVCAGQGSVTYSVPAIENATSYIWTLPQGASGTSTANSITVDYSESVIPGKITVKGNNLCGEGIASTLAITVGSLPVAAGSISGPGIVCAGQGSVTYSVPAIENVTSYIWTLPQGASGTSTANTITINYGPSAISGDITVKGSSPCGDGIASTLAITVGPLPAAAGEIAGPGFLCSEQNSATYTIPAIENATSYIWILPSGAEGTSTTNSITVDYGSSAISDEITVKGSNSCGEGATSTLAITVGSLPAAAGTITGPAVVCAGQNSVTYTVPVIENVTSYIWTLPQGASGTSTTNIITVDYGSSAISGDITVKGQNLCGDGTTLLLPIIVITNGNQHGNILTGKLELYPNPVVDELIIEIKDNPNNTIVLDLSILNSTGQIVFKGSLLNKAVIEASHLASGVYMVVLRLEDTFIVKEFIKQ